jgi:glycosyltransferase involved in cell wall biosynthesis
MTTSREPLVSVVTPFYNTAAHLAECIESVLAQTHTNFEYVLADNASTDGSGEIAARYAERDRRIRLVTHAEHLPQLGNYNRALRLANPDAAYVKVAQADDIIFPECLEKMVAVGEDHPTTGIIGAYYLKGADVRGVGLPFPSPVTAGRDVCRAQLRQGHFYFGSPTSVLYRAAVVRKSNPFYDEGALHADTEACYRTLEHWDFGFVHQVLTFSRVHADSIAGRNADRLPDRLDTYLTMLKYGPKFLERDDADRRAAAIRKWYYTALGDAALDGRDSEFWAYHRQALEAAGVSLSRRALAPWVVRAAVLRYLNFPGLASRLRRAFRRERPV